MVTKLKTKQDILGQVIQLKIEGSFDIDIEKLRDPLDYEGSVVRCFCFGCGVSTELVAEGANHLADVAETDVPVSWEGFYFVSGECIVCSRDYRKVILKKIP